MAEARNKAVVAVTLKLDGPARHSAVAKYIRDCLQGGYVDSAGLGDRVRVTSVSVRPLDTDR